MTIQKEIFVPPHQPHTRTNKSEEQYERKRQKEIQKETMKLKVNVYVQQFGMEIYNGKLISHRCTTQLHHFYFENKNQSLYYDWLDRSVRRK